MRRKAFTAADLCFQIVAGPAKEDLSGFAPTLKCLYWMHMWLSKCCAAEANFLVFFVRSPLADDCWDLVLSTCTFGLGLHGIEESMHDINHLSWKRRMHLECPEGMSAWPESQQAKQGCGCSQLMCDLPAVASMIQAGSHCKA